jgi:hypothetical protein
MIKSVAARVSEHSRTQLVYVGIAGKYTLALKAGLRVKLKVFADVWDSMTVAGLDQNAIFKRYTVAAEDAAHSRTQVVYICIVEIDRCIAAKG